MSELKKVIGKNLTELRLEKNLTQQELAEMLNYTDKSVSKWENGDATPPIETLKKLADLYGLPIDYLITPDPDRFFDVKKNMHANKVNKVVITLISLSSVWLIATLIFAYTYSLLHYSFWQIFIYSLPASFIVLIVFNGIWGKKKMTFVFVSCLVWSILLSFFIWFIKFTPWIMFLIGVPIQIIIILWSQITTKSARKKL